MLIDDKDLLKPRPINIEEIPNNKIVSDQDIYQKQFAH